MAEHCIDWTFLPLVWLIYSWTG